MTLAIIGAGLGRTGTNSMRLALERLGLGPCHHMYDVIEHDDLVPLWEAVLAGQPPQWDRIFQGYRATVDWPGAAYWRALADHYPDAKVLLTTRDPRSWWRSISGTILRAITSDEPSPSEIRARRIEMNRRLIIEMLLKGKIDDEAHAVTCFEAHNRAVEEAVPEGRRLTYRLGEGWEPLCAWLGVPVPDEPFPRTNSTEEWIRTVLEPRR